MRSPLLSEEKNDIPVTTSRYSFWQNPKVARDLTAAGYVAYLMDGILDGAVDLSTKAQDFVAKTVPSRLKLFIGGPPC